VPVKLVKLLRLVIEIFKIGRQICWSERAFESSQCVEIYHRTVLIIPWFNNNGSIVLPGFDNCSETVYEDVHE